MYRCSNKKKENRREKNNKKNKLKKHYNVVNPHKDDLRCKSDF